MSEAVSNKMVAKRFDQLSEWFDSSNSLLGALKNPSCLSEQEKFSLSALSLCQEHCKSIQLLILNGLSASALALLRPAQEALLRGYWLSEAKNADAFERCVVGRCFPSGKKKELLEGFYNAIGIAQMTVIQPWMDHHKNFYDDFSHGGFAQIVRRFTRSGAVGSSQSNQEDQVSLSQALMFDFFAKERALQVLKNEELALRLSELFKTILHNNENSREG